MIAFQITKIDSLFKSIENKFQAHHRRNNKKKTILNTYCNYIAYY